MASSRRAVATSEGLGALSCAPWGPLGRPLAAILVKPRPYFCKDARNFEKIQKILQKFTFSLDSDAADPAKTVKNLRKTKVFSRFYEIEIFMIFNP